MLYVSSAEIPGVNGQIWVAPQAERKKFANRAG